MSWAVLLVLVAALSTLVALQRRTELRRMAKVIASRDQARERGSHTAQLQYPNVDLSRCLGCGTCVQACPEEGVLELLHGQAVVVHGARCVGHGLCAAECPTGAIVVRLGDLDKRRDIPALDERFEANGAPDVFLAGEVTGFALIRTAITHGTAIAAEVARRTAEREPPADAEDEPWDLCIVGAGPAGFACSLEAKARGLRFVTLEQEALGGTVSKYPRNKLVMTQPVELPLVGTLDRPTYRKEELTELWERVAKEQELPIHTGVRFTGVEREPDGPLRVRTETGDVFAHHVCLALGRRGTPRKLEVPGEELSKVAYGLVDAGSFQGRRILVIGGGDSAVEAALGLAEDGTNEVTLSYRREAFFRLKARNEARLLEATESGGLRVLYRTTAVRIADLEVELAHLGEGSEGREPIVLPNDDVFILAGGIPPFKVLEDSGISFDPADRPAEEPLTAEGTGLLRALAVALALSVAALLWVFVFREYYAMPFAERSTHPRHDLLRSSRGLGLAFGLGACGLLIANLAYLLRRAQRRGFRWGSLRLWMTVHVATGILALIFALLHGAMSPQHTVGGHAFLALVVLVVTGGLGRYFYSFVPHAANGRELALDEVKTELAGISAEWDRGNPEFGERVRQEILGLVSNGRWSGTSVQRLWNLIRAQARLRGTLQRLRREGRAEGVPDEQVEALLGLARRSQRVSLMAAHFEELRSLLSSWRWLHRWVALLMVLLVILHVVAALRFGSLFR